MKKMPSVVLGINDLFIISVLIEVKNSAVYFHLKLSSEDFLKIELTKWHDQNGLSYPFF